MEKQKTQTVMKYQETSFGLPPPTYHTNLVDEETKMFRNGRKLPYQFPPINLLILSLNFIPRRGASKSPRF